MIKAIFFDIDGTLLSFKTHTVPQSTIDAINAVKQKGIKVFLATGRLKKQVQNLGGLEFDGFITVNGAYCVTTDNEVIFKKLIPKEELKSLIAYQENVINFPFAFMVNEGSFVSHVDETVKNIANLVEVPVPPVRNLQEMVEDEVLQVNLYVDKELEEKIMKEAFVSCNASRWHSTFADVNVRGIDKSTGIDKFLEYYNINKSETMAFGDGGNDIEMLKHVGIGVAMGNAGDDVKAVADYITDSVDENGVANALRHFGLIE
ncbi:MAG: Cof-type HAD-IIB family hydrolase [Prevotella sp.]|jgi:Cof subfamily protein (haloacid dehalogenase superfamily)|nr:Cof-type HAD-IIB family hydrolase [Prevotella sp.]